jgi:hypothetical protein
MRGSLERCIAHASYFSAIALPLTRIKKEAAQAGIRKAGAFLHDFASTPG